MKQISNLNFALYHCIYTTLGYYFLGNLGQSIIGGAIMGEKTMTEIDRSSQLIVVIMIFILSLIVIFLSVFLSLKLFLKNYYIENEKEIIKLSIIIFPLLGLGWNLLGFFLAKLSLPKSIQINTGPFILLILISVFLQTLIFYWLTKFFLKKNQALSVAEK